MKSYLFLFLLIIIASPCMASYVAITTTSLPNGTVDTPYSAIINASGGCTPYTWALVSGTLPAGVTKATGTGTTSLDLSGTPASAATYSFTISVTGCGGHVSKVAYEVVIQPAANHVVDLNWKASTTNDVCGYNVYRGPDGSTWEKINTSLVASTLYDDSTVANGSTYYYAVTAVDINDHESSKTSAVKAVIP
ncbi:MAG: putative Ig domain-containing protein [Candidatus Sulfotelmatobacter sp.]